MAAEALLDRPDPEGLFGQLKFGNNRASKFTDVLAADFASKYTVVAHQANTSTGFSGTLFKENATGELTLSFRSTEFIDDAVRDSKSNELEIKAKGWAFGQIDDMEKWFASLKEAGKLDPGTPIAVTGYSLGGHLATAFNLLHKNDLTAFGSPLIGATYTFNGAGVGTLNSGTTLSQAVATFDAYRQNGAATLFISSQVGVLYADLLATFHEGALVNLAEAQDGKSRASALLASMTQTNPNWSQAALLYNAMARVYDVVAESERLVSVGSGGTPLNPNLVLTSDIAQISLNYQIAVLKAGETTSADRAVFDSSFSDSFGVVAYSGRKIAGNPIANLYDLYGDTRPSGVANSQIHYGLATPIWIEDQPLLRGQVKSSVAEASGLGTIAGDLKLLVDGFSQNDFGDTHSLVLLVDSLTVQNTLAQLAPTVVRSTLNAIFNAVSNAGVETGVIADVGPNNQGRADGDSLEKVVNALARLLGIEGDPLVGKLEGGTWANINDRNVFYNRLQQITGSAAFTALAGKVTIELATPALADQAKNDFAAFLSLNALSPLVLRPTDATGQALLKQANPSLADAFEADAQLTDQQRVDGYATYSDAWRKDRAAMLGWLVEANKQNIEGPFGVGPGVQGMHFEDLASERSVEVGLVNGVVEKRQTIFGGDDIDILEGKGLADHLYGGAGNDFIDGKGGADWLEGNAGADSLYGGDGSDTLLGGAGDDQLSGEGGNDTLAGGDGADTYKFTGAWGKDLITDADGKGSLQLNGTALTGGKATGYRNVWQTKDADGNYLNYAVYDDSASSTGKRLVITKGTDQANTITVNNFDYAAATGGAGYLGIKLDATQRLIIKEGSGANAWSDPSFDPASLQGQGSTIQKGGGKAYTAYLASAAKAGDTITLSFSGSGADKL
ncbi:MAG: hypothetical protein HYX47_11280, partial [Burkholderiales bacterium]|nr:hypothetical protein [Burkholderiales bacterium]